MELSVIGNTIKIEGEARDTRKYKKDEVKGLINKSINNINSEGTGSINKTSIKTSFRGMVLSFRPVPTVINRKSDLRKLNSKIIVDKDRDMPFLFLNKNELEQIINELFGYEKVEMFNRVLMEQAPFWTIKNKKDSLIIKNNLSGENVKFKTDIIKKKFINVAKSKKGESLSDGYNSSIIHTSIGLYPCLMCNEHSMNKKCVRFLGPSSPLHICSDCYDDFLLEYTGASNKEIAMRMI